MKKYIYLLFVGICLAAISAKAQNIRTISGTIYEKNTKKVLAFATVRVINKSIGAYADINGKFTLKIPTGSNSLKLKVSYLGYQNDTVRILSGKNTYKIYLEDDENKLKGVVITGVSQKTKVRKDVAPIRTISTKQIENTSTTNVIDALALHTPGFSTLKTGPNVSKPMIHGLGFNRVLSLYDGVRISGQLWGDEHGLLIDDYNVKRAEVIEGPASLKYGSDALAGVVSFIPYSIDDTDKTLHGRVLSEYQSNNGLLGEHLRLTYGGAHWGYALSGSYRMAKNYQNPIDGRVYNTGFQQSNSTAAAVHRSKKGYSKLAFNFYEDLQGIPDGSRDSLTRKFTKQIYEEDSDNIYTRPVVPESELNSYRLSPLHQKIKNFRLYNKNHYEIGKGNINFNWAIQQNKHIEYAHPTHPDIPGEDFLLNTLSYSIQYNAPTFSNISLGFGINGMYQNNKSSAGSEFPIPNYKSLSIGGYLFGNWSYKKWTVAAGARYDIRNIKNDEDFYVGKNPVTGFDENVTSPDTAGAKLQYAPFNYNFSGITANLGATYAINRHLSLKANIARGYRAPNISELASNGLDFGAHIVYKGNDHFKPEFSLQQSLGINFIYNAISGIVGVFNNNISNYIFSGQLADANGVPMTDGQGNRIFGYQQAKAQVYGYDATISIHPLQWHGFNFNNLIAMTYGFNRAEEFEGKGVNGEYLPLIPPFHWISNLSEEIHIESHYIHSVTVRVGSEFYAAQDRYLALNGTETYTPEYLLFKVRLDFQIRYHKQKSLYLKLGVNNLFNTAYQSNMNRLKYFEFYSASPNGHLGIYNMGRNFTVKLILPF